MLVIIGLVGPLLHVYTRVHDLLRAKVLRVGFNFR